MKLKPGDYVCFREWDDMKQEFGEVGFDGAGLRWLNVEFNFTYQMRYLCGCIFLVELIDDVRVYLDQNSNPAVPLCGWSFSKDMFKPIPTQKITASVTQKEFLHILQGGIT